MSDDAPAQGGHSLDLVRTVQYLADRQAISDCLHRYCRGVDRFDRELMLSAYHPDAVDDHGVFVGDPQAFTDWAFGWHGEYNLRHHHTITNHSCEIDGDVAHSETYWLFFGENPQGPHNLSFGRYVDRLEKRGGEWKIAWRTCISETVCQVEATQLPPEWEAPLKGNGFSTRDRRDVSYARPLGPDQRKAFEAAQA
jgi:ketosteroid isomerase-like protein